MPKNTEKFLVGLGVSGGIAAYKAVEIMRGLQKADCAVRVAMTRHACEFIKPLTFRALTSEAVLVDDYAPENPDPIAHINFSREIDLLLIAPATANIIAKFANGIADDFLSSTYLALTAPVLIAPAMNTTMWNQPATQRNVERLKADGIYFIEPVSGELACKTIGTGKLAEVENIVAQALRILNSKLEVQSSKSDLTGEKILITTGATREEIDPVRFISNYSSGKMGFSLAKAARARGAFVTIIAGATTAEPPENIKIIRAESAEKMYRAVTNEIENATVFIGAAAVADYRPKIRVAEKIKKKEENFLLELEKTPDILAEVAKKRHENLLVIGFAAETEDVSAQARLKLERKNLDLIVANDVSQENIGFGAENNAGIIFRKNDKNPIEIPLMTKHDMADKILDEVVKLRQKAKGKRQK